MLSVLLLSENIGKYIYNIDKKIQNTYNSNSSDYFYRIIRKLCLMIGVFAKYFLGDWYQFCETYDTIILFDTGNAKYIIKDIHKIAPNVRIILWYWNPVEKSIPVSSIDRSICEIWSYHLNDCRLYDLKYNTQFYMPSNKCSKEVLKQDAYFVGIDKNRSKMVCALKDIFDEKSITYKFVLVKDRTSNEHFYKYSKPITYEENIFNIASSKIVVDLVAKEHFSGCSLRPFEAACNEKKLITNDCSVKNLKFYNPKNIFIWGEDSLDDLKAFVEGPYDKSYDDNIEYYGFENWLKRFYNTR